MGRLTALTNHGRTAIEKAMRRAFTLVIAAVFAWSAFVDNAAVCADDALAASSQETAPCSDHHGSDVPCLSCPCRLPSTAVASVALVSPQTWELSAAPCWPTEHLHTIDAAAPPTPPPLA